MGLGVTPPIVKTNIKTIYDSSNFRPSSIVPRVAKIFEAHIAKIIDDKIVFHLKICLDLTEMEIALKHYLDLGI